MRFSPARHARFTLAQVAGSNTVAIDDWAQSNPTIPPVPLVSYVYDSDGRVVNEVLPGGTRSRTYTNGQLTGYDEMVPGLTRATPGLPRLWLTSHL